MRALWGAIAVSVVAASCGPANQTNGIVGPTGGELCSADQRVCISVPIGALEASVTLRILPTADIPTGAVSDGYEIGPSGTRFLKPATVTFKIDGLFETDSGINWSNEPSINGMRGVDPQTLRVFTKFEDGQWEPLGNEVPALDKVRRTLSGTVGHLSPFVILRVDRLVDGGLPIEIDGGVKDAGVIIIPYFDAGPPDAGKPDAGKPDAGPPDAGPPPDAGKPDAGPPDAGKPDAGPLDAGPPDAGPRDAGPPDAGPPDAGPPDAGPPDAGPPDAGPPDAGFDAGVDAGVDAGADAGDGG